MTEKGENVSVKYPHVCKRCGYGKKGEWSGYIEHPKACPQCHQYKWDTAARAEGGAYARAARMLDESRLNAVGCIPPRTVTECPHRIFQGDIEIEKD